MEKYGILWTRISDGARGWWLIESKPTLFDSLEAAEREACRLRELDLCVLRYEAKRFLGWGVQIGEPKWDAPESIRKHVGKWARNWKAWGTPPLLFDTPTEAEAEAERYRNSINDQWNWHARPYIEPEPEAKPEAKKPYSPPTIAKLDSWDERAERLRAEAETGFEDPSQLDLLAPPKEDERSHAEAVTIKHFFSEADEEGFFWFDVSLDRLTIDRLGLARFLFQTDSSLKQLQTEVALEDDEFFERAWAKAEADWGQKGWTVEKTALNNALSRAVWIFNLLRSKAK